jgi:hypothetical protein
VLLQVAIAVCVYSVYARKYPPTSGFYASTIDKHRILEQQQSPRLIFIGGSATCFGINSGEVAVRCGYHPVNLGLHALLGLRYMITECEGDLRSGDVVVISPEYPQYGGRFWGEPDALLAVMESRPENFKYLGAHQLREFMDSALLNRAGIILRAAAAKPDTNASKVYNRNGFNATGDMVAHYALKPNRPLMGRVRFTYDTNVVEDVVQYLNGFSDRCAKKGIKVFLSHPPIAHSNYLANRDDLLKLETHLQHSLTVPMLDSMVGADLADDNFFDTAFHLNRPAVIRRSNALADELNTQLSLKRMAKSPAGS